MANNSNNGIGRVRASNQEKILHAAEREFEEFGFGGARIQRIADRAGLPKANIHYYYKNKHELYMAVLNGVLELWNRAFDEIDASDDPAIAIENYIRAKVEYSRNNARASRIFSSEIIHGAPNLKQYLEVELREWISARATIFRQWVGDGKLLDIDPIHLIFLIWGATQHYADYSAQVTAVYQKDALNEKDYNAIADSIVAIVLGGCIPSS